MRFTKLAILILIAGMLISAGIAKAEHIVGKWEGFRGIFYATNIEDVNDMALVDTKENITLYTRTTDKLSIGKAKLTEIWYRCYKDKFYGIAIQSEGRTNFNRLKEAIFAYYGEGTQDNKYIDKWIWRRGDIFMMLSYNEFSEDTYFGTVYLPIHQQKIQDDKDAAEDAEGDF